MKMNKKSFPSTLRTGIRSIPLSPMQSHVLLDIYIRPPPPQQSNSHLLLSLSHHQTTMASDAKADEQSQRHMEHAIHDTISKLTRQLTALCKSTARSGQEEEEESRIITLAGSNKGAWMKGNLEEMMDTHGALYDEEREMSAYTNSNYQAVNNSILLRGCCTADDPGVHIVISGYADEHGDGHQESDGKNKKEEELEEKEEGSKGKEATYVENRPQLK